MRALAVLMLVLVPLSGCLAGDGTMTAKDGLGDARDRAKDWLDDPQLVGIASIEPFKEYIGEGEHIKLHLDDNPGDGRAPGWLYVFTDGDSSVGIAVATGLGVLAEMYYEDDPQEPIGDWSLDSDDAMKALKKDALWPDAGDDTSVLWVLGGESGMTFWLAFQGDDDDQAVGVVDAQNGTVLFIGDGEDFLFGGFEGPAGEAGVASGSFYESASSTVSLQETLTIGGTMEGPGQLDFSVQGLAVGAIDYVLEGPQGVIVSDSLTALSNSAAGAAEVGPGDYTLTVSTSTAGLLVALELQGAWGQSEPIEVEPGFLPWLPESELLPTYL